MKHIILTFNIKKLSILVLLIVASIQCSYSQITFGFKLGLNQSKVQSNLEEIDYTNRRGLFSGAIVQAKLTEKRFVRMEVLYSVKGSKFLAIPDYTSVGKSNFNYLNIPLLQGYRPIKNLSIVLGPEIGYLISAKSRHDSKEIDITEEYNKFDLAADLGLGYQITPLFGIEARYSYGFKLMNIYYEYDIQGKTRGDKKYDGANRVLQFGLTYHFVKKE